MPKDIYISGNLYVSNEITASGSVLGGGGGVTVLNDLTDVTITGTPNDNDALAYDTATGKFIPQAISGGGSLALNDLTDANTSTASITDIDGHLLTYDTTTSNYIARDAITITNSGIAINGPSIYFESTPNTTLIVTNDQTDTIEDITSTSRQVTDPTVNLNIESGLFYIDKATNRVGIGTTTPQEDLDVNGNIQINTGATGKIVFYDVTGPHEHAEMDGVGEGTNGGAFVVKTKADGGAVTENFRIQSDGGVQMPNIAAIEPSTVSNLMYYNPTNGQVNYSGDIYVSNNAVTGSLSVSGTLSVDMNKAHYKTFKTTGTGTVTTLSMTNSSVGAQAIIEIDASSGDVTINGTTSTLTNAISGHDDITIPSGSKGLMTIYDSGSSKFVNVVAYS